MSTRKKIRTIRILAFVIPFIAVLIGMLAGSFAPFGGKDVMTSGGMTEQLTHYYELYDHVHGGAVSTGNGYDFSSVFTYYLSDPLNLLILIFPRTAILGVINLLYAVKLGLAGLFMSIFLTHRKKRLIARKEAMEALRTYAIAELAEKKRLKKEKALAKAAAKGGKAKTDFKLGGSEEPKSGIGRLLASLDLPNLGFSTAFALSAYMVGQGLNVSHLTVIVLFPLLLMALDNLLENGKWRTYAALMTASVFCSLHMAIIVFIFSVVYTAAYDHSDLPGAVRNILLKLVSDLLAAGAGAVIIFSAASGPYFGSEISTSFPYGHVSTTFFDAFKALFPKTGPSSTLLYGYNIDIFCGMLAVFLVVLYVVNPNISLRRKLGQCGILAALTTALFLVTPNYLFNGLFYSRLNLCIFGFLFVFQLLSMAYEELINLDHSPAWSLHLCAAGLVALVVISLFRCDNYDQLQPFLVAVEFLFVYYILIVMYRSNSMTRWLLLTLLGLVTTGELVYCYVDNLRAAGSASSKYEATLDSRVYEVSRQIQEKEPDAKIVFYDPESSMSTPLSNTLSGVDYVLTDESLKRADSMLELTDTVNGVNIFKNPYSLKGFFLPEKVTEWYYDSTYPFTSLSQFATEVVGSKKLFTNAQGQFSNMYQIVYDDNWMEDMRNVDYIYTFVPSETGDLYGMVFNIRHFGTIEAGLPVNVVRRINDREYLGRTSFTYSYFNEEGLLDLYDRLSNTSLTIEDESHMTIRIDAPEDGYYVLPVPRNSGWTADQGTLTDLSFSQDLMMVSVKKGENTIHLSYRPTFLYIGLAISVLVLALLILLAMKDRIRISTGNRAITSVSEVIRENYVYLLTFGITTMVFIIMLWYTSSMPFGKNSVLIGDGYIQAYNGYRGIIHDVKDGSFSILNWNMGISIDRYMDYAGYALSPWSYLKLLIIPDSLIAFDQAFSYFLSFMLSGLCMVLYLTHRRRGSVMKKNDWRLIVIGVAYALSSYTIATFVYGGFGFLTTLPLIMLGMERLVYDKKPALYIFLMFSFMGNAYYAFMLCEFLALYFFTMEFDSIKDFFMKGIRFALCSIAAAGLSCYRLLPYYFHSVQSPYKTADVISPTTIESGNFLSVFSDTMSFRQPTVVSDDYFKANIYVGILVLFFVPLYLLNKKIPLSVRIRRSVLALLLFLGFGTVR